MAPKRALRVAVDLFGLLPTGHTLNCPSRKAKYHIDSIPMHMYVKLYIFTFVYVRVYMYTRVHMYVEFLFVSLCLYVLHGTGSLGALRLRLRRRSVTASGARISGASWSRGTPSARIR